MRVMGRGCEFLVISPCKVELLIFRGVRIGSKLYCYPSYLIYRDFSMHLNPTWEMLRLIGKSRIVGLTALIPFIGYFLLFNENIVTYISISPEFAKSASELSVTISRLHYLYFGLTTLGISSILYSLFCPKAIKENGSEYEYSSKEMNVMTYARLREINNKYGKLLKSEDDSVKELQIYLDNYINSEKKVLDFSSREEAFEKIKKIENNAILDILRFNWNYINKELFWLRLLTALGYTIGFILVLIPSAIVFISVIENIITKL